MVRRRLAARAVRSVAQGVLVVDFVLYLATRHRSAGAIGPPISGTGLLSLPMPLAAVLQLVYVGLFAAASHDFEGGAAVAEEQQVA